MNRNNIKRNLLIPIGFLLITATLSAQPRGEKQGPPPIPNDAEVTRMVNEMSSTLKLSENQERQIMELYISHFNEVRTQMRSAQKSREKDRESMEALRSQLENQVKSVLTKKQIKAFEKFEKDHRPPQHGQRPPRK